MVNAAPVALAWVSLKSGGCKGRETGVAPAAYLQLPLKQSIRQKLVVGSISLRAFYVSYFLVVVR